MLVFYHNIKLYLRNNNLKKVQYNVYDDKAIEIILLYNIL